MELEIYLIVRHLTGNVSNGQMAWFSASLDISSLISRRSAGYPDTLWITIEQADAGAEDCAGFVLNPEYTKWCEGVHI